MAILLDANCFAEAQGLRDRPASPEHGSGSRDRRGPPWKEWRGTPAERLPPEWQQGLRRTERCAPGETQPGLIPAAAWVGGSVEGCRWRFFGDHRGAQGGVRGSEHGAGGWRMARGVRPPLGSRRGRWGARPGERGALGSEPALRAGWSPGVVHRPEGLSSDGGRSSSDLKCGMTSQLTWAEWFPRERGPCDPGQSSRAIHGFPRWADVRVLLMVASGSRAGALPTSATGVRWLSG